MGEREEEPSDQESPDFNKIIFDADLVILPYLRASDEAIEWSETMGIPPLTVPDMLEVKFDPDLSRYTNYEIGTLMNRAKEVKSFFGRVVAETTNRVRDRQRALKTTRKVLKKMLLRNGFKGTATALNDEVDTDMRVIRGDQALGKSENKLTLVEAHYKAADDVYKTLSRNVTLITDENETWRRVDSVEGMRRGNQNASPRGRGRRAERVTQSTIDDDQSG